VGEWARIKCMERNHLSIVAVLKQHTANRKRVVGLYTEKELIVLDVIYLQLETNELER
jgi:hypothetical protein